MFADANNQGRRTVVRNVGKALRVTTNEPWKLVAQKPPEGFEDKFPMMVRLPPPFAKTVPPLPDGQVTTTRQFETFRSYYFLPESMGQLEASSYYLGSSEVLVSLNGKQGLKSRTSGSMIIPATYDEIIHGDFEGDNGGYILRNGTRFGLFISDDSYVIIEPVFSKIQLLVSLNYGRKRFALLKLFDDDGKFFCYADGSGKLYYSAK